MSAPASTPGPLNAMKTLFSRSAAALLLLAAAASLHAQTQFQGWCSKVKIRIEQELTLERTGFEATLTVTDNDGSDAITDFSAALTFEDPAKSTATSTNDSSALFFVRQPTLSNVTRIDGTGVIAPTKTATVTWFIIPTPGAGGADPQGKKYNIGCRLGGKLQGLEIPKQNMFALPDTITVKPEPELRITYFQPRDVTADDPFTPEVEAPVPFTLGVLVHNQGHGVARNLKIDSKQPKIVENKNGLLLVAQLLGARVNDSALNESTLLVNLGDINPSKTGKGSWDMITSLSGHFVEFKASYTHAPELGGEATSLIKELTAQFIAHEVLNDDPGRDKIKDFLADVDRDENEIPDALYETNDGNILPVNYQTTATQTGGLAGNNLQVAFTSAFENWIYVRVPDPGQNKLPITRVVRSDGKVLNANNYWTNTKYAKITNARSDYLNLFDKVADNTPYTYAVTYNLNAVDTTPPVTRIRFSGEHTESGGVHVITRDTQIYFTSEDASPVSIEYKIGAGSFVPALPFTITTPGTYTVTYRAKDRSNNQEADQTAQVSISGSGPFISVATVPVANLFLPGSSNVVSVRPGESDVRFTVGSSTVQIDGQVDVFQGVIAWPRLAGVPPSPTPLATATLTVSGDYVDFYKYKIGSGVWTSEFPAATPISLSGLSGDITVSVLARSQYGGYLPDDQARTATWTVTPGSPLLTVSGLPVSPTAVADATLTFGGAGLTDYRWNLDNTYFRAEQPVATALALTALSPGTHTLKIIGKRSGTWQDVLTPTTITWVQDGSYGSDFTVLPLVKNQPYTNVAGQTLDHLWNGTNQAGVPQLPGVYTVRLTLTDTLARSTYQTKLVFIDKLSSGETTLTPGGALPDARGAWTVWQERVNGVWNIRARNLVTGASAVTVTSATLAQEKPRTDGRYVTWQARLANGSSDIYFADLFLAVPVPQLLARSPNRNEINPVIDFPWIAYQTKPVADASAPWQVEAKNITTGARFLVNPGAADQLDPTIHGSRLVWQDWRDVGPGEIYYADLESGDRQRITNQTGGQYHPSIWGHTIIWQDNRNTQLDLWKYDLRKGVEERVTNSTFNEINPVIQGAWVVYLDDSLGADTANLRLFDLDSGQSVPVTQTLTPHSPGSFANGSVVWADGFTGNEPVTASFLPSLQPVMKNENTVVLTPELAGRYANAFALLTAWHSAAGVQSVTRFQSLAKPPVTQTATWSAGAATGANFTLTAGDFLWIKFDAARLLDLGPAAATPVNLSAGKNVLSYGAFPVGYTAYDFIDSLGSANVGAVRMLDAVNGVWRTVELSAGARAGANFLIPRVTALLVEMKNPVNAWKP